MKYIKESLENAKINVKSLGKKISVNATPDLSLYYSGLSKKWAVSDEIVDGEDYSSKYYANVSKNSAQEALQSVETAKENALRELEHDAGIYVNEAKVEAEKATSSANLAETTVNDGIVSINSIIQSTPEKFAGFGLFDTKLTDHVLEGQDAVGWALQGSLITMTYPDAVNKIKELYANGDETEYRGITCKRSTDGRYVADISQKDVIDELFVTSGVAEFYVLDAESDSFYLPRSKWFNQMTLDTSLVNKFNEAGLPNIEGTFYGGLGSYTNYGDGAFSASKDKYAITDKTANGGNATMKRFAFSAKDSNPTYGNSDTVQPPSNNKLLYYKVGNTVVNETQINVGNLLTEVHLKADKDLANTIPSQSFKDMATGWGMLDYNAVIIIPLPYTAVKKGLVSINAMYEQNKWGSVYVNERDVASFGGNSGAQRVSIQIHVNKNDVIRGTNADFSGSRFIPLMGA